MKMMNHWKNGARVRQYWQTETCTHESRKIQEGRVKKAKQERSRVRWSKRFLEKHLTSMHSMIGSQLKKWAQDKNMVKYMVAGKTVLFVRKPEKGHLVPNSRPITCLPLITKLLLGMFIENIYVYLEKKALLSQQQKGCRIKNWEARTSLCLLKYCTTLFLIIVNSRGEGKAL